MDTTAEATSASFDEIHQAIDQLSMEDLRRLEKASRTFVERLGHQTQGRGWEDLQQEAVCSALEGRRNWNPEIQFEVFLHETMKSIVWSWRTKRDRAGAVDVGLHDPESGRVIELESPEPSSERALVSQQEILKIEARFTEDHLVREVIEGWRKGFTGPEIQELLGVSEIKYRAAVRRMRRNLPTSMRSQK